MTEIPDEDVPLSEIPDEDVPLSEIPDEDIPLAETPQTGDNSMTTLWVVMASVSLMGLAILTLGKKREENEK